MRKNYLIAGTIIVAALVAFIVIQNGGPTGGVACTMEAKLCPDGSAVGRQGPNCEFAPCPSGDEQTITVDFPQSNSEIGLPLIIRGTANVFEDVFGYRLLNAEGVKLLEGFGETQDGAFSLTVNYQDPKTDTGTLEMITFAPVGGLEIAAKSIPVRFAVVDAAEVKIYFNNTTKDPKSVSCETTYPVTRRIAKTPLIATEALNELLRGVTGVEVDLGFMTALNPNVELQSLKIQNGVAYADFNELLQKGVAGSCRVTAIRSQIESTLKQFSGISSVVISINGRSEDVLQP